MKLRVTLVQQSLAWHDPEANRRQFEELIQPLAGQTDLVVLPETFTTGYSMKSLQSLAEPVDGTTVQWLRRMSAEMSAAITGSVITAEEGRHYNRLFWVTPDDLREYNKRHLFRMAHEHEYFTPGREHLLVQWRGFRVCPLICYDLRFPVFSRRHSALDYDLLLYVANWPTPRHSAWRQLLRARAIENLSFVAGVNRVGRDGNDKDYAGGSAVIDFLGEAVVDLGNSPAVATVEIDRDALTAFRERFPAHLDADRFTLTE